MEDQFVPTNLSGLDFQVGDIPVDVSLWTLFMISLFTLDSFLYLKRVQEGEKNHNYIISALFCMVIVIGSVVFHEVSHAITAHYFGVKIIGAGITGLGAYVRHNGNLGSLAQFAISLAGPITNFSLALIFYVLVRLLPENLLENSLQYSGIANWNLFLLNISPLFITDGGRMLEASLRIIGFKDDTASYIMYGVSVLTIIVIIKIMKSKHQRIFKTFIEEASPSH